MVDPTNAPKKMAIDTEETKKTIGIFAVASFLNDMGSDIIYPIWPLFVTGVLGANMAVLGFIDGIGEAIVSISQALSGYVSDRIQKRKIFIWIGYLCGALSRVGYALSSVWSHLIPFKILDRMGKMRGAPRDAIIAEISTTHNRGKHFGILRAMDNLGAVCGVIICILLFKWLGYRLLFGVAAVPSAISVVLILFFLKERKAPQVKVFKGLALMDLDNNFKLFLLLSALFALGSFSYSFLLIYAKEFGFNITFIPVLYLVYNLVASLFSVPFGRLSDRIGRKPTLMLAYLLWMSVAFLLIVFQTRVSAVVVFMLYGMHKGALEPVQRTFVSELAPEQLRASTLGGYQMVIGLCALPSSLIAGFLWDEVGMRAPLYFSLILTVTALVLFTLVRKR